MDGTSSGPLPFHLEDRHPRRLAAPDHSVRRPGTLERSKIGCAADGGFRAPETRTARETQQPRSCVPVDCGSIPGRATATAASDGAATTTNAESGQDLPKNSTEAHRLHVHDDRSSESSNVRLDIDMVREQLQTPNLSSEGALGEIFSRRSARAIHRVFARLNEQELSEFSATRVRHARRQYLREAFVERRSEFVSMQDVRIFCGSWNVNGKVEEDYYHLGEWINCGLEKVPDILVIALQEMVDLSAVNVMMESATDGKAKGNMEKWSNVMRIAIARQGGACGKRYELIAAKHMVGICLLVFASDELQPHISGIQKAIIPTGAGGLGNKGAVCIRANIYDTRVAFVSAHLYAHRSKVAERNADFHSIATKKIFRNMILRPGNLSVNATATSPTIPKEAAGAEKDKAQPRGVLGNLLAFQGSADNSAEEKNEINRSTAPPQHSNHTSNNSNGAQTAATGGGAVSNSQNSNVEEDMMTVLDHDLVFWMGDLNYRIVEGVELNHVYDLIHEGASGLAKLRELDQLNQERSAGRAFQGFSEGVLEFGPTYKYIPGQRPQLYDDRPEKKMRCPSWCDRVLWKEPPSVSADPFIESVSLVQYRAVFGLPISDHLPVNAVLDAKVRRIDQNRRLEVCRDIISERGLYECEKIPLLRISERAMWFSDVRYEQNQERPLVLHAEIPPLAAVVGEVESGGVSLSEAPDVPFKFASNSIPAWLSVTPMEGVVPAGGKLSITIEVLSSVAVGSVSRLGADILSAMVVIFVEGGEDRVFPVTAFLAKQEVYAAL